MAVLFKSNTPQALLNDFKDKIDKGHVVTWSYDKDGDFTHTPDQWRNAAWMTPSIDLGGLRFNILGNSKKITTKPIYGVFHGRLVNQSPRTVTICSLRRLLRRAQRTRT